MAECSWTSSYTLNVPLDWCSGVYIAKLKTVPFNKTDGTLFQSLESYIIFVVRDDNGNSSLLFQTSVTTYQAYNTWGARGLYGDAGITLSYAASFNRPYERGLGTGEFLYWEYPMVRWLERNGYDVSYITSIDTHSSSQLLLNHKAFLSVGHDEYWSDPMRNNVENAASQGISFGFFGANPMYWQVRFEPSNNASNRTMVCYKNWNFPGAIADPFIQSDPAHSTGRWRDPPLNRPEQLFVGQMYRDWVAGDPLPRFSLKVKNTNLWPFTGTGLKDDDEIPDIVAGEIDDVHETGEEACPVIPELMILAASPVAVTHEVSEGVYMFISNQQANVTLYKTTNGARIFSAGTFCWSHGLDDIDFILGNFSSDAQMRHQFSDRAIQRITANVLNTFVTGIEPGGPRIGVLNVDGTLFVKEGTLDAEWWIQGFNIQSFVLDGDRIGVIKRDNNCYVREGIFGTEWVWESSDVQKLVLSGDRIAILKIDGNVFVKEGALDAEWTWEGSDVQSFALAGDRIEVLHTDGNVFVKEGALDAEWTWESSGIKSITLT